MKRLSRVFILLGSPLFSRPRVARILAIAVTLPLFAAGHDITPPTYGTSTYFSSDPVVASNGETFLTLWNTYIGSAGFFVFGSLADSRGKTLTPVSFVVSTQASVLQVFPSGRNYVALLLDHWGAYRVATIAPDGKLVSLTGGATSTAYLSRVRVAFDGSHFFVVAEAYPHIVAITVDMNGNFTQRTLFSDQVFSGPTLAVVYAANGFFVAASDVGSAFVQRFAADGSPLGPKVVLGNQFTSVAIASNGRDVGVVWAANNSLSATVLAFDGTILARSTGPPADAPHSVTWNGKAYVATGANYALRIDERAVFLDPPVPTPSLLNIASNGSIVYGVAPNINSHPGVFAVVIETANAIEASDPQTLSVTLRRQEVAALASDGVGFLSTWIDQPSGGTEQAAAMFLSPDGAPLDAEEVELGSNAIVGRSSVAFGASAYLIAWQRAGDVVARLVRPGARILDAEPVVVARNASIANRAVAWDGRRFIVIAASGSSTFASFIDEQGVVTAPVKVNNSDMIETVSQVTWDGKHYLLASTLYGGQICTCSPVPVGAVLTRFDADGSVSDLVSVSGAAGFHIASSGHGDALLVIDNTYPATVAAYRIRDEAKLVIDAPVTLFKAFGPIGSDVAWNGTSYTVAWHTGFDVSYWVSTATVFQQTVANQRTGFAGPPDSHPYVAVAANANGSAVISVSEVSLTGGAARVRAYAERDLPYTPPPPAAPHLTSARLGSDNRVTITWESDGQNVAGFIVERAAPGGTTTLWAANAFARSVTIGKVDAVRVKAFGPGGTSEPSSAMSTLPARRRTIAH